MERVSTLVVLPIIRQLPVGEQVQGGFVSFERPTRTMLHCGNSWKTCGKQRGTQTTDQRLTLQYDLRAKLLKQGEEGI
jgi:hypothetical protein